MKLTFNQLNELLDMSCTGQPKPIVLAINGFEICRGYISAWELTTPETSVQTMFGSYSSGKMNKTRIKIVVQTMDNNSCVLYVEEVVNPSDTNKKEELEEVLKLLNKSVVNYKQQVFQ